jgi:hypothetical protein
MVADRRRDVRIWPVTCGLTRLSKGRLMTLAAASRLAGTGRQGPCAAACAEYVPKFRFARPAGQLGASGHDRNDQPLVRRDRVTCMS